jgi:hypothetical protein
MQQKGKFILFTLEEFKEWLFKTKFTRDIMLIQNHHTYLPDYKTFKGNNHFKLVQNMETYHKKNGFSEIAQNITTFPDGTIMICRSFNVIPAGIKGANKFGLCIEHIGNFDVGKDEMTKEHKDTIVKINAMLCKKFNLIINTNSIIYHHWYDLVTGVRTNNGQKSCPGSNWFDGNTVELANENFIPKIVEILDNI